MTVVGPVTAPELSSMPTPVSLQQASIDDLDT